MWMNTWEIDEKADLIDQNSDGWAYWRKGSQAAAKLMDLIQAPETATDTAYKKALVPIKSFCTRQKFPFPQV